MALLGLTPETLMGTPEWEELSPEDRNYVVDQWAIEHKAASPDVTEDEMRQFNQMVDQFRSAAGPSVMERAGSFVGGVAQSIPQSMAAMAMTLPTYSAEAGGIIGNAITGASAGEMMRDAPLTTRTMLATPQTARNIGTWAQRQIPGEKAREFDRMNAKLEDLRTTLLDGPDDSKAVKALAQQVAVAAAGYNGDDPTQYLYAGMADGLDRPDGFADAVKEERRPRVVNDYGLRDADLRGMRTIHADPENLALAAAFRETRNPAYFEELSKRLTMPAGTLRRSAMIYANEVPGQEEYETAWGDLAPMRYVRGAVFGQAESPIDTALSLVGVGGLFRGVKAAAAGPLTLGKIGRGALKSTAVEGTSGAASAIGADSQASGGQVLEQAAAEVLGEAGAAGGGFLMQRGLQGMMRERRTAPLTDAGGEGGWLPDAPEAAPAAPPFSPDTEETPYVDPGTAAAGLDLPSGPGEIDPRLLPDATAEESLTVGDDLTPPTPADPMGTVPETPVALGEQKRRVAQGNQAGMIVPGVRADALPAELLPGENDPLVVTDTPDGAVIHGLDVSREEILAAQADGSLMQQLGYATSEKPVTPDATVVTVRTPDGTEVSAEAVAPRDVPAAVAAAEAKADPQDVVQLESPEQVVAQRAAAFQDPMAFTAEPAAAGDLVSDFAIQPRPAPVGLTEGVPTVDQAMAAAAGPAPAGPTTVEDIALSPVRAARNVDLAGFRDRVRAESAAAQRATAEAPPAPVAAPAAVPGVPQAAAPAPAAPTDTTPTTEAESVTPETAAKSRAAKIEAWADQTIAESRTRFNTGIDPEVMAAYAVKATAIVARGVLDFAMFSAEMLRQFGEAVRPHLEKLFAQANGRTEADFRTVAAAGQTVESLPDGYDINRFGIRMQADERLRASWRARFAPALYKTFTEEGLARDVKQWIADNGGLAGATSLFLDEASGLKDFERNALGQQLAIAWDLRAVRMERQGNTEAVHQAEAALESVSRTLEAQGTKAGQALRAFGLWSKLSPRGLVRATQRRVDAAREEHLGKTTGADPAALVTAVNEAAQPRPEDKQLQTDWDTMLSNTPEALRRRLADLLQQLMPRPVDYRRRIDETIVRAAVGMREQLTQQGADGLVRQWFQMMAGPRDRPGPLSAFDRATQELLRQTMREAAARAGLVAENESVQPDAIDRIVMGMSNDPLKMDKLAAAEEIMQERLAGSPDLRAAWEEATVAMASQIAGPALLRRSLRGVLQGIKPNWTQAFNTGRPMQEAVDGIRAAAVGQVMAQVQARLGPALNQNPELLPGLEAELNAAFGELAAERYASWQVAREAQVNRARVAEARRRFLEALRPGNMTQARIDRLDALLQADALGAAPDARVENPLTTLLGEHLKAPVADFVAKARALGVPPEIAQDYDQAVQYHRDKAERAARERAIESLMKSLAPKPARVVGPRVPAVVTALQKAGKLGVATRGDFLDAWADAFELPRMTPELAGEIRQLVSAVDATPRGSWLRQRAMSQLMSRLALHEGMKSADILTSYWYANILSGIGTQLVNITGNASHLFLKSVQHILTTNPKYLMPYLQGMLSGAKQGIQQGAMAFRNGDPVLRSEEKWEQTDVLEMLWSDNPRTLGGLIAKYGAASWGRYVFRALTAMDSFFYTTAKEGRAWVDVSRSLAKGMSLEQALGYDTASWTAAQAEAANDLAAAGISVPSTKQVDRRAYEILEQRRGADLLADSRRFGARTTFNYEPEGTLGAMSQLLNWSIVMVPPFRIVVPFTKIVANLTDTALDWTPYGIVRGVMGRHMFNHKDKRFSNQERQERIVSGALSLVAGAALYSMAKGNEDQDDETVPFMIYGTGPRDKAARDQMPEGWRPMTVKIGGRYISYSETPLNLLLGAIGGAMDLRRYGSRKDSDEPFARAQALLLGMGNGVLRSGMLSGVAQLFDTVRGQAKLSAFPSRPASGLIPMQGLMRNVAEVIDPVKLDTGTFAGTLMQNIPILRGQGTPLLNEFGEPVRMPGPWLMSRLVTTNKQSDPDAVWLAQNKITLPGYERDIVVGTFLRPQEKGYLRATGGPLEANRLKRAENAARVEAGYLTPEERIDFIKRSGAMRRQAVRMIRQQTAGRNIEPKFIENMVQNRVSAANRIAMRQVLGLQPK